MQDVTEFLATLELNPQMGAVNAVVTYQDSCHLAHGQRVRSAPRKLLMAIPGLTFREMPGADLCCGSAGIYNVVENEMSMQILASKMASAKGTGAGIVATANPGCMLQLQAGVRMHGTQQRVMHVLELMDLAYRNHVAAKPSLKPWYILGNCGRWTLTAPLPLLLGFCALASASTS